MKRTFRTRISRTLHWKMPGCAVFVKESRLRCAEVTTAREIRATAAMIAAARGAVQGCILVDR